MYKQQYTCTFCKPCENSKFAGMSDTYIDNIGKNVANTITRRDFKGIGSNNMNLILVIKEG